MPVRDFAWRERWAKQDLGKRKRRQFLLRPLLLSLTGSCDGVFKIVEELPDSLFRFWGERSPRDDPADSQQ